MPCHVGIILQPVFQVVCPPLVCPAPDFSPSPKSARVQLSPIPCTPGTSTAQGQEAWTLCL